MANEKIYIADDDENIREAIKTFLKSEGYEVTAFENGDLLLAGFHNAPSDLVILDVMMPGSNGFAICTEIRKTSTVPIIMLTARDSDLDYATGMSLGSDDYFTKPFSAMSLVMRVKAIFRRIEYERQSNIEKGTDEDISCGDVLLSEKNMSVTVRDEVVSLTPNEYALLVHLMKNHDRAVSRDELLEQVWGFSTEVETRAADDTVRRLRKKLSKSNVEITAVWGFGFRLKVREEND
jgi:DNA-binding response OmpR family regulator